MRTLCIIPARGGSKGVPGKNVAPLLGKPVMAYVIEAALAAKHVKRVVVSTESHEIGKVAARFGVAVIDRPAEYATDSAPIDLALRHAVRACEATDGRYDAVVWMQANVPTVHADIVDRVVARLEESSADSVATVVPYDAPPQWAWRLEGDRMVPLEGCYSYTVLRQEIAPAYHYDGAVNAFRRDVLMATEGQSGQAYFGQDRRAIVLDNSESVEIDEPFDMLLAEVVLRQRGSQKAVVGQ
jgi:CMP-N,N'-diacetyllegionaminic acid synthase